MLLGNLQAVLLCRSQWQCSKLQLPKRLFIESALAPSAGHCRATTALIQFHGTFSFHETVSLACSVFFWGGKSNPGKVFLLIKMYKYFRENIVHVYVSAAELQEAGLWEGQPEDSEGRSELGTVQQLKEIPIETVSMIDCRLSSGSLDFHFQFRFSRTLSRHSETLPTPFTSDVWLCFWWFWLNDIT